MKKTLVSVFILAFLAFPLLAQRPVLPKGFAPGEKALMPDYLASRQLTARGINTPPSFPVRTPGEWEEIQSLVIAWTSFEEILTEIVREAQQECEVIVVCTDSNQVINYLSQQGVTTNNVRFVLSNFDTIWMRDYGPNTVYGNDVDSLILIDWIYNRPRPNDDAVPDAVGLNKGIPVYSTAATPYDLVHTGGNFMADGWGSGFSSRLIIDENGFGGQFNINPKNESEIDSIMYKFMGIDQYIKMTVLPYDAIHHIDMHMKLLDEETILVGEYPSGTADGPQIEANLQYVLSNFQSTFGTDFRVIRIPMPPDSRGYYPNQGPAWNPGHYRTYTNSVLVNKTILVPVYEERYDTTALRIWSEAMPGYKVVGIDCNDIIPLSGALHCITKEVGVSDPLWISHQRLRNTTDLVNPYPVTAEIQHKSGIQAATLWYSTDTSQGYQSTAMSNPSGNTWTADIPATLQPQEVFYYIHAEANSGKQQVRPIAAPDGYLNFWTQSPVSVNPQAETPQLRQIYPNPAKAITCIPMYNPFHFKGKLSLVNTLGQEMLVIHQGSFNAGEQNYFFFAQDLPNGSYFVHLEGSEIQQNQQVVIQH